MLSLAISLLFAASGSGDAPAASPTKCHLTQIATIPVVFRRNKPLVEVTINGQKALMLADTGAVRSLLFTRSAEVLGAHATVTDGRFVGIGGARNAKTVVVANFEFGGSTVTNLRLYAVDGGLGDDVVGVFGADLLGQADTEFDLNGGVIRLFSEKDCARTNLAYWTSQPMVADLDSSGAEFQLDLELNGHSVHATVDSGAETSVVTNQAAARVGVQMPDRTTGAVRGLGTRSVKTVPLVFDALKIGDEEIRGAKLLVGDFFFRNREAPVEHQTGSGRGQTEMLLGADFLRSHRVIVSTRQRRMYFTYAGGPVFQVVAPPAVPTPSPQAAQ